MTILNHLPITLAELPEPINRHLDESSELNKKPLIAIIGPTASGKTSLGIAVAQKFNGEIISADSRQIYRYMDIGTAKPMPSELLQTKHHLIDLIDPDQPFSLANYQKLATQAIDQILAVDHLPILVGGTGLYISAITQNYHLPASQPDAALRQKYQKLAEEKGHAAVHQILQKLDPAAAQKIHSANLRYVIRAIEIASHTNAPKSDKKDQSPYHVFYLQIDWPRAELYRRIEQRIDQQITTGLIEETAFLIKQYGLHLPALSSLGYQEIAAYIEGKESLEKAVETFKKNTRNYAKRQLTWFRKFPHVYFLSGQEFTLQIQHESD